MECLDGCSAHMLAGHGHTAAWTRCKLNKTCGVEGGQRAPKPKVRRTCSRLRGFPVSRETPLLDSVVPNCVHMSRDEGQSCSLAVVDRSEVATQTDFAGITEFLPASLFHQCDKSEEIVRSSVRMHPSSGIARRGVWATEGLRDVSVPFGPLSGLGSLGGVPPTHTSLPSRRRFRDAGGVPAWATAAQRVNFAPIAYISLTSKLSACPTWWLDRRRR